MEFTRTKIKGHEVTVIFTGSKYFFHSHYYGLLAIAERTAQDTDAGTAAFTIRIGNSHTIGGFMGADDILPSIKRFITRCENQFISKRITYTRVDEDLNKIYLTIEEH
ncbi:MAG: hypothetical protein IIZ78_03480, partial [Clostridiales bacterium]|nr:hypothetical protein [Clostridiales bacterium]